VQPASQQSSSAQSTTPTAQGAAPPAQASGGFGAKAAVDVSVPQSYFFFPEPGTLTEPDCIHGEIRANVTAPAISRWTTTLCGYADPQNPGYTRYYDWNNGADRDNQWWATIAQANDGWIYEQNRWSTSGSNNVWFRYRPSNPTYTEISVTPWGASQLNGFEAAITYAQRYPGYEAEEAYRMAVARAAMLVSQLQVWHLSGPTPYTQTQITSAEQGGGVPPALQNITNVAMDNVLANDPVGRLAGSPS
jgi:hypothetical protein